MQCIINGHSVKSQYTVATVACIQMSKKVLKMILDDGWFL